MRPPLSKTPQRNGLNVTNDLATWIENGEEKLRFSPNDIVCLYDCALFDDMFEMPVNRYTIITLTDDILITPIDLRSWLSEPNSLSWKTQLEASRNIFQVSINPPYRWRPGIFSFGFLGTMDVKPLRETPSRFRRLLGEWNRCGGINGPLTLHEFLNLPSGAFPESPSL